MNNITINQLKSILTADTLENLLNNTYTPEWIQSNMKDMDHEEFIDELLSYIINEYNKIILLDKETGEITGEINLKDYGGETIPTFYTAHGKKDLTSSMQVLRYDVRLYILGRRLIKWLMI